MNKMTRMKYMVSIFKVNQLLSFDLQFPFSTTLEIPA